MNRFLLITAAALLLSACGHAPHHGHHGVKKTGVTYKGPNRRVDVRKVERPNGTTVTGVRVKKR